MQTILLIDSESDFTEWAQRYLTNENVKTAVADRSDEGLKMASEMKPDLVICELHVQPIGGMEVLKRLRMDNPNAMVVLTTGFPPTNSVIEAMKLGAYDFLRKEALPYDLRNVVETALKAGDEVKALQELPVGPEGAIDLGDHAIIGRSSAMQEVFKLIGRVSRGDAVVTITGESGCGKEIVARAIHRFSPRAKKEFVAINCAAIPENLLESELFGHEKGSFTGAQTQRQGRFEQCDGGTLFLDEIGDMPMPLQSKILRVLQEGEYSRVGGNQTLRADVRIIAATHRNLEKEVEQGKFREDLFYRLNVVRIHIPPLRERTEDIRLLAGFFLQRLAKKRGLTRLRIAEDTYKMLENYNWPGNVRELENTIQRAVALANADVLLPRDIPLGHALSTREDQPSENPGEMSLAGVLDFLLNEAASAGVPPLEYIQAELARHALSKHDGQKSAAAALLSLKPAAFQKWLKGASA